MPETIFSKQLSCGTKISSDDSGSHSDSNLLDLSGSSLTEEINNAFLSHLYEDEEETLRQSRAVAAELRLEEEERTILNSIETYCYDQGGCRMLQKKLEEATTTDFALVMAEKVKPIFATLMVDQFGNYLS